MGKSKYIEGIKEPLFAAANSGRGFVSFYGEIFSGNRIKKRYIIKGGPGTGKSSFMKKVAEFVEKHRASVEYYKCSSDPTSIDGIIINGNIAIIDGTAPHSEDIEIAGARDEIVNLGAFWNDEKLMEKFNDITELCNKKSDAYRLAYKYLSAGLALESTNFAILEPVILKAKMEKAVERIIERIPKGEGAKVIAGIEGSVGMKGQVRLNSYAKQAQKLYVIDDYYNSASILLAEVVEAGLKNENLMRVSYNPISAGRPDAVYFCESSVCFAIEGNISSEEFENVSRINMKRFVNAELLSDFKAEMRSNFRIIGALVSSAEESMKRAGEFHFLLEEIYKRCMDFNAQNSYCEEFCHKLLKYV